MREAQRLEDVGLRHFERTTFNHHDGVLRTGDDQLHVGEGQLLERRVEHPVSLHATHAHAADRTHERDLRGVQRERRGEQRQHVGVILLVGRDDVDEHLHFVLESFREQRADRAVDDAARQDLVIVGTPFALDEAARDLAGGVRLLLVLYRQGEERERTLVLAHGNGGENHRLAELDDRGTRRLLRHTTGLDDQWATGERPLDSMHHLLNSLMRTQIAREA